MCRYALLRPLKLVASPELSKINLSFVSTHTLSSYLAMH